MRAMPRPSRLPAPSVARLQTRQLPGARPRPVGRSQLPPTLRAVTKTRRAQERGAVSPPERERNRHCVPTRRASATSTEATSVRSGPAVPLTARTERAIDPIRG